MKPLFAGAFPDWSPQAASLWAKTDRTDKDSTAWLNLPQHMLDSAQVGAYLWENYLSANHRRFISKEINLTGDEAQHLTAFLCGAHDVGKASHSFATQLNHSERYSFLLDKIRSADLPLPSSVPKDMWLPHSAASYYITLDYLSAKFGRSSRRKLTGLCEALDAHHGLPSGNTFVQQMAFESDHMGTPWFAVHTELLDKILELTEAEPVIEKLLQNRAKFKDSTKMLFTGLVIMADWIASNAYYFPLGSYTPEQQHKRFEAGIAKLRLPAQWSPEHFAGRSPAEIYAAKFLWNAANSPRPVQEAVLDVLTTEKPPKMLIIEAPMGEGKTEAALVAAEHLAEINGCNGIFFGAPTMATTDALFNRIRRWAEQSHNSPVVSMYLGHSKNQLNASYGELDRFARFNLADESNHNTNHAQVIAHQWFRGRKQGILSSLVVATVDQVLMMALQSKHLMLRHLGLAGKVVVIDEVHSYGAYMGHYMAAALTWLGSYGVPVVLLSATLPQSMKNDLALAYRRGLVGRTHEAVEVPDVGDAYPVITAVGNESIDVHEVAPSARRTSYSVLPMADDPQSLEAVMGRVRDGGGCLLVICNTVDRAQAAYWLAKDAVGEDAYLLHSRFTALERVERESYLAGELGPDASLGQGRPERRIVVATQVVEQSLDLDFDCMITDIAPIDLVLQRLGRLHRHRRPTGDRPEWAQEPVVYVRGMEEPPTEFAAPVFARGVDTVYQPALLLPTCKELALHTSEGTVLDIPRDIPRLVRAVYSTPSVLPAWNTKYEEAVKQLENAKNHARGKSATFRAELSMSVRPFADVWATQTGDLTDEQGAAQVRDTEPTIEVVLVQEVGQGYYRPLPWLMDDEPPVLANGSVPDEDLSYLLAQATVRLPYQMSRPWIVDQVLDVLEGTTDIAWQKSHLLRGLLQLKLDDNYETELADFRLRYSQELGLQLIDIPYQRKDGE